MRRVHRSRPALRFVIPAIAVGVFSLLGPLLPAAPAVAAPSARVNLGGTTAPLPTGSDVLGPVGASATLLLDVSLKPRDPAALDAFVADVSNPESPEFRHFLAAGQFGKKFGPTSASIAATRSWLSGSGLLVGATASDGLLIPVSGTTAMVERTFGVSLNDVKLPSGRVARYNPGEASVPSYLSAQVESVIGLTTVAQPHSEVVRPQKSAAPLVGSAATTGSAGSSRPATSPPGTPCAAATATGPGAGRGYTADQLAATYGFGPLYGTGETGAGMTVAVYELEPYTSTDISTYLSCYGLSNSVTNTLVDGGAGTTQQGGEASLDIEGVAGLAPGAAIDVYTGPNSNSGTGPIDTYQAIVGADTAQVITTSWGECEAEMPTSEQQTESTIFAVAATQGQSVTAAAGDSGSSDCYYPPQITDSSLQVDDPADQPGVTGVGGTSLTAAGATPIETVWNNGAMGGAGGGGVSSDFAQPAWQSGTGVDAVQATAQCAALGRTSCREVPDVAASADPNHGYVVYNATSCGTPNGWCVYGGTSAAAPLWAALLAVVDQRLAVPAAGGMPPTGIGLINPILYSCDNGLSFLHDVTAGNNSTFSTGDYQATTGYDEASGWGSPDASSIQSMLANPNFCLTVTGVSPASGPEAGGGSVTITGTGFTGATNVRFGATSAPAFTVQSSTTIVATVPPGPASGGTVDVTVADSNGTSGDQSSDLYRYASHGYWLVASDGGIFSFGGASFHGSTGALTLNRPIVGMAATTDGQGYWLVASDGGIFAFGDASFYGSTGALTLNRPIVGMAATPDGQGYWLVASDGGIFSFGDAQFYGSTGSITLHRPIVGMAMTMSG